MAKKSKLKINSAFCTEVNFFKPKSTFYPTVRNHAINIFCRLAEEVEKTFRKLEHKVVTDEQLKDTFKQPHFRKMVTVSTSIIFYSLCVRL